MIGRGVTCATSRPVHDEATHKVWVQDQLEVSQFFPQEVGVLMFNWGLVRMG